MNITKSQLQNIISEEVRNFVKSKLMNESREEKTVKATPDMLQKIIAEEVSAYKSKQLLESKNLVKATPDLLRRIIAEEKAKLV